jgi:hypothetical protein
MVPRLKMVIECTSTTCFYKLYQAFFVIKMIYTSNLKHRYEIYPVISAYILH